MIISHQHRFIFLRTRKTASTSLELALSAHCGPDDVVTVKPGDDPEDGASGLAYRTWQNLSLPARAARDIAVALRRRQRPRHYTHDPAELVRRHVGEEVWRSYFTFAVERDPFDKAISVYHWMRASGEFSDVPFDRWIHQVKSKFLTNWGIYTINDAPVVDFMGRYETLEEDVATIAERIGLPGLSLTRAKGNMRTDARHYSDVFDEASRRRIEVVCAREIAQFGYAWQDASA